MPGEGNKIDIAKLATADTTDSHDHEKREQLQHEEPKSAQNDDYSTWKGHERRFIVFLASAAAVFSPLSANIYYPIFNELAVVLDVSDTLINLTVSTYMIMQGIAPTFVAGLSDGVGRRPAYLVSFMIYIAANIGLALQTQYVALAVLRCVQSAGSSSTVALARAVVAEIVLPAERGMYVSLTSIGIFIGPSVGPVIGGILARYLTWRAVFWFLAIASGVFFLLLLAAFPETCRNVVGNGSIRPAPWNMSVLTHVHLARLRKQDDELVRTSPEEKRKPIKISNVFKSVTVLLEPELAIVTLSSGLAFAAFYAVNTSVPSVFAVTYGLSEFEIGLCFLSIGGGCCLASAIQGKLIDWNFARHARRRGVIIDKTKGQDLSNFPIEAARLEIGLPMLCLCVLFTLGYGWSIHFSLHLAAPLAFMFFMGLSVTSAYSVLGVLIIDIWPGKPALVSAGNNLVRCLLGAAAAAAIVPMMDRLSRGWAFTLVALLILATIPSLVLCLKRGQLWRASSTRT